MVFGALIVSRRPVIAGWRGAWRLQSNLNEQFQLNETEIQLRLSVSHELRAPIASVRVDGGESRARAKSPNRRNRTSISASSARKCRRLSGLIENVLDFSRSNRSENNMSLKPDGSGPRSCGRR